MININDIKNLINKKYPDSCFTYNTTHNICSDNELIAEAESFFYNEKLNWCGCGVPEVAKRCIRDYLNIINSFHNDKNDFKPAHEKKRVDFKNRFGVESIYDSELLLCLAYAMDAAGFTEHGSSIGGAWLTDEGRMFLSVLNENKDLDIEE